MKHYPYLIVGGGMTADAAVRGIRELDRNAPIGIICRESDAPYARPPLSKGLWKGKAQDAIGLKTEEHGADVFLNAEAVALDLKNKEVLLHDGQSLSFDRLLLATGGRPRRLPFGGSNVIYFRTLNDYRKLRSLADSRSKFVVIGGGYIGSEIAAALVMQGKQVTMVLRGHTIGGRMFPADLGHHLNCHYREHGVELLLSHTILDIAEEDDGLAVSGESARDGQSRTLRADGVVAGLGLVPNSELARAAGLDTADGIWVDAFLRTNHPDVYAAGDVASIYHPLFQKRMRVEHEDNARASGRAAGRNMAGADQPFDHLPYFYSDLFDLGYEAVGELGPEYEQVEDWIEPYHQGTVYYVQAGHVRGVLLWNNWNQVSAARHLITETRPISLEYLPHLAIA